MISVNWPTIHRELVDLHTRYRALPSYLAKKHLLASMRRAIKASKGPQILRKNTPPLNTRRGRRRKGDVQKKSTGDLRRSVTTKAKWIGRFEDGAAVAGLGYKYGMESQKAIWHEFGTTRMAARGMMEKTFAQIRGMVASKLAREMAAGLEKAAAELGSGKNPGMSRRGLAAGL